MLVDETRIGLEKTEAPKLRVQMLKSLLKTETNTMWFKIT